MNVAKWFLGTTLLKWLVLAIVVGFGTWGSVAGYQNWQKTRVKQAFNEDQRWRRAFHAVYNRAYFFRLCNGKWAVDGSEIARWSLDSGLTKPEAAFLAARPLPASHWELDLISSDRLHARYRYTIDGTMGEFRLHVYKDDLKVPDKEPELEPGKRDEK